jgi:outer membrane protein W
MKKIILLAFITLFFANGYSQEKGKFRVGLDFGYVPAGGGGGGLFSIEPKFNIKDNMNVGLRLGGAAVVRDLVTNQNDEFTAKIGGIGSFVGTYDYYFHKSGSSFAPYVGGGVGYYSLANVEVDDADVEENSNLDPAVSGVFGGLIRGGFEWSGFRMGLEYNFIPDSDIEDINGDKVGTAKNAYLGIHIGFFVGGGKWGR